MIDQRTFDEIADRLVQRGVRVTLESVAATLQEGDGGQPGHGASARILQGFHADWKRRRRYNENLACLEPVAIEQAFATLAEGALATSRDHGSMAGMGHDAGSPPSTPDIARELVALIESLREQVATIAEDTRVLREQVGVLTAAARTGPATRPKPVREGRKRGLAAVMARSFWDKMMQGFVEDIRRNGPMSASQLLATLDADAREMAEAAFERIDLSLVQEKVDERVKRGNYFRKTPDGLYDVL